MSINEPTEDRKTRSGIRSIALVLSISTGIASSTIVLTLAGIYLDRKFDSMPLWTLCGFGLSLIVSGYELAKLLKLMGRTKR